MVTRQFVDKNGLNRYRDIQPFSHNRVLLGSNGNYINASHMHHMRPGRFIACQGPLAHTIGDHWQMVWEQDIGSIFAIGKLAEGMVEKCALYWPTDPTSFQQYVSRSGEEFTVSLESTSCEKSEIRKLRISKNNETRLVTHFHFTEWPDHQVVDTESLLALVEDVLVSQVDDKCTLIHCSAGVGRTGCVLTLASLLAQVRRGETNLSVLNTAMRLRLDRLYMMQTTGQYLSVYAALALVASS